MATEYKALMIDCARAAGVEPEEFVLPAEHDVILNGIRLHWLDWGNRHLPHVLLLHGGSLTAHTWDMAVLCLRHKYHFVALDQRGHGDSEWTPQRYLHEDPGELMLEDTRQFIEYLNFEHMSLVGMSMGGMNTIRYASQYPQRLDAVGIVDVAPVSMVEGQKEMRDFSEATEELFDFDEFLARARTFMPHRPEAHLRYSLTHSLKQTETGKFTWKRDRRARPSTELSAEELKVRTAERIKSRWEDVSNITLPTILFRGAESKILSPETAGQMIDALPNGRLAVIADATHNVHSDNPRGFASELDGFLEEVLKLD
jgi:pimeloyl-ACP methyl ester carboxylesterase